MHRKPNFDRNKNPIHRFAAINKLMGAHTATVPMRADAKRDIEIAAHIAFERLIHGGDKDSLYVLAMEFDAAHELAVRGCGKDYLPEIERGMAALIRTKKEANLTGAWKFSPDDVEAVSAAMAIHDAQLDAAPRALVLKVLKDVMARVQSGKNETEFEAMLLEAA